MAEATSHLYLYQNTGLDEPATEWYLHQYTNTGLARPGDPFAEQFLHQYTNINNDQPHPTITHIEPADLLVPGSSAVIDGYNFEGRNDGGDIQPKVFFYGTTVLAGWNVELDVITWDINPVSGQPDHVTVLLPLQLPSTGFIIIVQTGADKNPIQPHSNFWAVAVQVVITTLTEIDFDDEFVGIPLSAAWDSYWIGAASLSSKLYVTSKRAKPFSFDGTDVEILDISTFTDPTQPEDGSVVLPEKSFPRAFFAARKHDRMWVANIRYADGTEHRSRVHYSDPVAPEIWWADSYYDFDPDDGQWITGMVSYGEGLLVFKNHNVQLLTGMSQESFSRQMLINNTGTTSPYTIQIVGGLLFFLDRDTGVWSFDGAQFSPVSEKIRTYLLEGISYNAMYVAAGYSFRNKYVLTVPWGTSQVPNKSFVYDVDTQAWTEYDYGFRDAVEARGAVYAAAPREKAGVYMLNEGLTDDSLAIPARFETPWIAPGGASVRHRTQRIDMSFSNLGGAVTIGQYVDFDGVTPTHETTRTVSEPDTDQVINLLDGFSGRRWETMQLKVNNVSGSDFQLNHITLLWTSLRRNRGVTDV